MKPVVGNLYDKYRTCNPLARVLMGRFLRTVSDLARSTGAESVLEVGCGEGHLSQYLFQQLTPKRFAACDVSLERVEASISPSIELREASVYALPYADCSFDLVVCCEVLEHLEFPESALEEIARVARNWALFSTPNEPFFRGMNLLRGAYLSSLGNTPGHLQHFGPASLRALVEERFVVSDTHTPFPWIVVLAQRSHT